MKKSITNSSNKGKVGDQKKKVFSTKKPSVKQVVPSQQIILQQTINQSTLNDTLDQFVNTTDMNLDNNIEKPHTPYSPKALAIRNNQLDTLSDFNHSSNGQAILFTKNNNDDGKSTKLSRLDDLQQAQSSRDYQNILTVSTPSIINDQKNLQNRSESTLSNITAQQVKIFKKPQNEEDQEDFNISKILPSENSVEVKPVKSKKTSKRNSKLTSKRTSKKNSVSKVQQFSMNEEDEYEYEEEDEEEDEDDYEYEDDEDEEEQKENQISSNANKIMVQEHVTLDPSKNQFSIEKMSIEAKTNQFRQSQQQQQNSKQQLPHSLMQSRNLQLDLNLQDSTKMISISPTFGNSQKQGSYGFHDMYGSIQNNINDIENYNPRSQQAISNIRSSNTTQVGRFSQNINGSQGIDMNGLKSSQQKNFQRNSRQIHPLTNSIGSLQNQMFLPQFSASPNHMRIANPFSNQEMQMFNLNQPNRSQSKPFQSRTNSISRGPTPARGHFSQAEMSNRMKSNIQRVENTQNQQDAEPTHCKICLESDCTKETGKMITPCKCSGTLRNVHEECLKTWIITQQKEIMEAQCEVCMKTYEQSISFGLKQCLLLQNF